VIGQTLVRELFDNQPPMGFVLRLNNHPMTVVGTLTRKGANMMGMDQDDIVIAPWRTIKYKVSGTSATTSNQSAATAPTTTSSSSSVPFPSQQPSPYPAQSATEAADNPPPLLPTNVDQILVRVASEEQIPAAMKQITAILHERHRIRAGQLDDFNLRDMTEMTKAQGETTDTMSSLLLLVALISLVVGGVGIMNIMLVSVTERTREIGLRMAVGARARDILKQFLVEAVLLCLLGGIVGIATGCLGTIGIRWAGNMGWIKRFPTEISVPAVLASVAVSALVGVTFGFYPAWKASRLDPIEALRYE
jgi:ABC-type antimicrobial peptide transport system permease subunit